MSASSTSHRPKGSPARSTRRSFLKSAALWSTISVVPRHVLGGPGHTAPSERLNIASVGCGGMGFSDLRSVSTENIVALCDVDHGFAGRAFEAFPKAARYTDFREMLDKQKDIDAVMIGTPDHTHAVISIAAMSAGKHVYCQKPLTHDIREARRVAAVARETGVVTQMGIQRHANEGPRLVVEWIRDGLIGDVTEVDAWCSLSYYPFGHAGWSTRWPRRPKETPPLPDGLAWDLWLGPAAHRPYHRAYHPSTWRAWWDFGTGMMGDRGVHTLDSVMWALDLGAPSAIDATSMGSNPDTHPLSAIVTFQFPARGPLPPVKVNWYEGTRPPRPPELEDGRMFGGNEGGILFKGTKGLLMTNYTAESPRLIPESAMQAARDRLPAKTLPRVPGGHYQQWVRACKGADTTEADFDYAARLTEICLLGNVAKRMDTRIHWDAETMQVTNLDDANAHIQAPYREGWSL